MLTVNFNGHDIALKDELFERSNTLRLIQKTRKDALYIYDVLDLLVEGGTDQIHEILGGDPSIEEVGVFVEKLFTELPALKNSSGSQSLSEPASQRLEQTYKDTTTSTLTNFTLKE